MAKKDGIVTSANIFTKNLEKCDIITAKDVFYPLKKGEYLKAEYDVILEKQGTVRKGEKAGEIKFFLEDKAVLTVPCYYKDDVQGGRK